MTRLYNFTRTQETRRDRVFLCALELRKGGGLYNSDGENINGMSFNES